MKDHSDIAEYADWLADLTNEDLTGEDLRNLLATRIASAEAVEHAVKELEISRRIRFLMIKLQQAEIEIPADFEAKLMARVGEDETLLNLLEVYLNGFSQVLIALTNVLLGLLPDSPTRKTAEI